MDVWHYAPVKQQPEKNLKPQSHPETRDTQHTKLCLTALSYLLSNTFKMAAITSGTLKSLMIVSLVFLMNSCR